MAERYDFYVHDNRKITFNLTEPIMREDSGVTDFVFHIPKILNELEVSDWQWWLVFVNAKKEKYSIALTLSDDPERPLEFNTATYTVDYAMSIKAGSVQFALEAINAGTGGAIDNEWHTLTYETKVKETLQGNQAEYAETESDIISALLEEVRTKMNQIIGGATPEPKQTVAQMTDPEKIYLYTGTGDYFGYWYYHNGTQFVPGGVYGAEITDPVPTQGSTNAVSSGGVYDALHDTDTTLSQSGQAADAKETGDRIDTIKDVLSCEVTFTEILGYINTSGEIGSPSSYGREVYTDEYIPVTTGDTLRFYMYSTTVPYVMWSKLALYDINKTFIRRIDIASGTHTDITNYWTNTDNNVKYVRYTYRTGTPAAGQWVYTKIERMVVSDINAHVAFNKAYTTNNCYISTNVTIGNVVSFTPVVFSRFAYAIIPCNAGDTFTITGRGAGTARLWAFVDENKTLISKSIGNAFALNETITAPSNSAYLIANFDMLTEYSCYKGVNVSVTNDVRTAVIQQGVVHDLPSDSVAMPAVDFYAAVQDSSAAGAKPTIYNNGEWFVITYGENLDGTGTDIPKVTESGVLAMKYKKFRLVNGVESNVSYGTIAQKGTTYTDYQGNTAESVGGWGLPSGVGNMQYFTTAYTGSYTYNGEAHYGMTPCCCSVDIANDGTVTFGTIKELTLDIDGTVGKFDVTRLSPENNSYLLYMTTAAPYYSTLGYKWMIPVIGGIAYFTSDNGIDWTYQWTLETPYQAQCEVMCVAESGGDIVFAARTQTRNSTTSDTLYIGKVSQAGTPNANYKLPFSASRAFLIRNQNDILLFYTPASKNTNECIRIIIENGSNLYFWKWFTIWQKATWYLTCYNSVFPERFSKMYLCGGNGEAGSTAGMTFIALSFDTTSPRRPTEIPFAIT